VTWEATHCLIQGMEFRSIYAAAKHFGVAPSTVSLAIDSGRTDFIGTGRNRPVPTTVDGVVYPSKRAAERQRRAALEASYSAGLGAGGMGSGAGFKGAGR
jgi:hypothetical protein